MTKRHPSILPTHPGEILSKDTFPALGLTKPAFAEALGVSRQTLHQVMTCARSVTPEMALRLEAVVGGSAASWLAMQADYDLYHARKSTDVSKMKRLNAA